MSSAYSSFVTGLTAAQTDALVEIMYLAATADGEFTDDERAQFTSGIESMTERKIPEEQLAKAIAAAEAHLENSEWEDRLVAIKDAIEPPHLRKLALAMAIAVTAADGLIRTSERELILQAAEVLEIDGDTAANMVRDLGKV
jgi:tellurite resistance protein